MQQSGAISDTTWNRILALAGAEFKTKRRVRFTYSSERGRVVPRSDGKKSDVSAGRLDFEKCAMAMRLGKKRSEITNLVMASSYVIAILTDPRVAE
jgi:hypothetical protein